MKTTDRNKLIQKYLLKYEKELRELTNKHLVEKDEIIFDLVEDKKTYLKEYETEELKEYIN